MLCYPKVQQDQEVQEGQGVQQSSMLSRILRVATGVLEALVAQEGRPVQVCHSLGYLVNLELQGVLVAQALTLLWVPQVLVAQGFLVAQATLPPPVLPSLL